MNDIERLIIEQACSKQINRFARLNDLGDYEALAAMFTEDGIFARPTKPGEPLVGRETILEAFKSRPPRRSVHLISNTVVQVQDISTASAHSCIALFAAPLGVDVAHKPYLIGHFEDDLRCVDGHWLFASRIGGIDFKIE